ncbi:c-type cytochrome [Gemmata sp.]|uniref:c-type cytochrome n=1 Tax=Gemmata sp. TaxID=1914242 RepID=UPI003F6EB2B4
MRYHSPVAGLAVLVLATAAHAVEPSDLKPGLVAAFTEPHKGPPPPPVLRLEPTVALALKAGETPHPKLAGVRAAAWKGYVNVTRPGKYTFSANVQNGTLRVKLGGKEVLVATGAAEASEVKGDELQLDGGVQPFEATFGTTGAPCRAELFWVGPGFVKEPLPHQFLGHVAKERSPEFSQAFAEEQGRFKFEELACIKCHRPAAGDAMAKTLADRTGPNLADLGKRVYAGWLDAWLADPSKVRPHTTMPKMFADDEKGKAERYAVGQYLLATASTPLVPQKAALNPPGDVKQSFDRGKALYTVAGCAACHQEPKPAAKNVEDDREPLAAEEQVFGPVTKYALGAIGSKTRFEPLAAYLQNPLKTNPHGRMPHMNLTDKEAADVARYLCRVTDDAIAADAPPVPKLKPAEVLAGAAGVDLDKPLDLDKVPAGKQWAAVGSRLFETKGCVNCHSMDAGNKPGAPHAFAPLEKIKAAGATGCIAPKPDAAKVPVYKLDASDAAALATFLKSGLTGAGTAAPAYSARVAIKRFNCLNCHTRDGEGGIPVDLATEAKFFEKVENVDDVRPPTLTGVGHKTRTSWLKSVLTASGRARPWMGLRMPQYGEQNVGFLPEALAALEGTATDDTIRKAEIAAQKITLGRQIVGKAGLGCISCHDIGGVPNTGTRGPDLSTINQRVRYEWYERWLHQPLRMAPGTRMPQAFVDGKSTLSTVLNGDPKGQAEAMWTYLSLGPGLPLPEGMEPPKGLTVLVKDRPEVLRTFMTEAGSKAIAVGYPGGVNLAFSADQCRIAYSWAGNFIDATPVWNNRGGAPAKLLGPKFWSAPAGHPWGLTASPSQPPDFAARATNPAFGLPLPLEPARIYDGPMAVRFDGYALDKDGRPTFRYRLSETPGEGTLTVAETPVPMRGSVATGFVRKFAVETPANVTPWLLAGQSVKEPRVVSASGEKLGTLDLKAAEPTVPAAGARVVLPQDGDKAVVLEAIDAPAGAAWRFVPKPGGGWSAVLRLPATKEPWKGAFDLATWAVPRDDDALLKDLSTK